MRFAYFLSVKSYTFKICLCFHFYIRNINMFFSLDSGSLIRIFVYYQTNVYLWRLGTKFGCIEGGIHCTSGPSAMAANFVGTKDLWYCFLHNRLFWKKPLIRVKYEHDLYEMCNKFTVSSFLLIRGTVKNWVSDLDLGKSLFRPSNRPCKITITLICFKRLVIHL